MESDWRGQLSADYRHRVVMKINVKLDAEAFRVPNRGVPKRQEIAPQTPDLNFTRIETLKKHQSSGPEKLHEIKNIAVRVEEKIYTTATNQSDYMRKISLKLLGLQGMENRSAGSGVNHSDLGSQGMQQVNNQGQPLPIPVPSNHPQSGQQILSQSIHNNIASSGVQVSTGVSTSLPSGSGLSQSTISNIASQNPSLHNIQNMSQNFVNQRQIPGRQQQQLQQQQSQNSNFLYRQHLHQIAKHNLQQNYSATSAQSQIHQQHQNLLQPSSLSTIQQNQQPVIQHHQQSIQRQQQTNPMGQPTSATNLQHNQLIGQQSSYSDMQQQQQQTRLLSQQNNLSGVQLPHQHSVSQHNNFSVMHQQHLGPQSSSTGQQHTMLNNQHSTHVMQSKVSIPQQNQSMQGQRSQPELQLMPQLQTQSGQLNMKPQPNMTQREMQQRIPTSGAFQQQNVIDQQKQIFQQQRAMPEASSTSSDSTAQTANPNSGDWQEEVYQKIKAMKDKYMPELSEMNQKITDKLQQHDSLPQQQKSEQVERLKHFKQYTERCMALLQVPKTNITLNIKEKLGQYEAGILNIIPTQKRTPGPHLQQPLPSPHMTQVQPHENHINSPNSTMLQLKQLHNHRQMPQQYFQKQQLLPHQQNHQLNRQTKQQLHVIQLPHMGVKMESLQRPQLKSGPPFSPQIPSPNIDQQNTSVTKSGTGTPLQSANSPFTMSSPSTPSTSHIVGESEKVNSGVSSLSNAGNIGHQQNVVVSPAQSLPFGTPGISASPLLAECASPEGNHGNDASLVSGKSSTIEQPMEQLLKVVKSISAKSLSASVSDIGSVVSMVDSLAGSFEVSVAGSEPDKTSKNKSSRSAVGEDLVATTKCRLQATTTGTRKMKRLTSTMPLNIVSSASSVNDSFKHFNCLEASELESTATSTIKRPRIERSNPLLEEIRGINQKLIDTVVDISEEDTNNPAGGSEVGKGTVVKCSFSAVALCPNIKSQYASALLSLIQPLQLLVPANYPNCSPILLDKFPVDDSKGYEDLSMKAKWRFRSCIRRLSEAMSLEEMARTWDVCARQVISEYAQQSNGGGTFTSKFGAWEDCTSFTTA
ncbi:hypothetical protein L2E82_06767 [Cichorium intybus]|uniref:Uncharacterized protein n=1 Tax=Cichorium intybus TaxID=13427 RepID=A0ACB9HBJ4_CICIN|nr:hypothetical protein L2E82_06767 [Cichorium intybus]